MLLGNHHCHHYEILYANFTSFLCIWCDYAIFSFPKLPRMASKLKVSLLQFSAMFYTLNFMINMKNGIQSFNQNLYAEKKILFGYH